MTNQTQAAAQEATLSTVQGASGDELQSAASHANGKSNGKANGKADVKPPVKPVNLFAPAVSEQEKAMAERYTEEQSARQLLAEAADHMTASGEATEEAKVSANKAGTLLLTSMLAGRMDRERVTSIIGENFGYRLKGDAKTQVPAGHKEASKTPFGVGEELRKRIFRVERAHEYGKADGDDRYFAGDEAAKVPPLPKDDVLAVVNSVLNGKTTLWRSYDNFGELRRKANENRESSPAFNLRTIGNIRAGLAEDMERSRSETADPETADPAIRAAYIALINTLGEVWGFDPRT